MPILDEVLAANDAYAADFAPRATGDAAARGFAILTCMDARLDPAKYAGLAEGDAHVIRNAGGRASDDAIRSLVISYKLLGTGGVVVIHHTTAAWCSSPTRSWAACSSLSLETAALGDEGFYDVGEGPGSPEGKNIDWLTISDQQQAVVEDVAAIRNHPLVEGTIPVYGYVYHVETGRLVEVARRDRGRSPDRDGERLAATLGGAGPSERIRRRASAGSARHRAGEALGLGAAWL